MKIMTLGVLGAVYRGSRANLEKTLTHVLVEGAAKTRCGRIRADHLVDEFGMGPGEIEAPSTCRVCAARDPRNKVT